MLPKRNSFHFYAAQEKSYYARLRLHLSWSTAGMCYAKTNLALNCLLNVGAITGFLNMGTIATGR